jgi:serine/threonine-protein kinase
VHVLVSEDLSLIKLRGFGLRLSSQRRADGTTMATTRTVFTGLSYMSPEQAKSVGAVDGRSNVYSIGVVFYELLTGRVPRGRFMLPSQLNSEVPPEIDALVLKCVAARPEERFPSVTELKRRLAALEDQLRLGILHELQGLQRSTAKILRRQDEGTSTATEIAAVGARPSKSPLLWVAIGAAVLALVLVAVFVLMR